MSIAESNLGTNGKSSNANEASNPASPGTSAENHGGTTSEQRAESRPAQADQSNENCLAQAQVNMPWLDFNARLQLKSNPKKKEARGKNESAGFKIPGFSIKTKDNKKPDANTTTKDGAEETARTGDDWTDLSLPKKRSLWRGWEGLSLSIAGIALPTIFILGALLSIPKRLTLVLLNHPMETLIELLLIIGIPLANYFVWSALCKNSYRFSLLKGLYLGAAIGTSIVTAVTCMAAVFAGHDLQSEMGSEFSIGFTWMAVLFTLTAAASIYLANRTRLSHDFAKSRMRILCVTIAGAALSTLGFASAEARPWFIRIAEEKALSNVASEQKEGWKILRALNPEKEILMECSDSRAAGLCGVFLPIKTSSQHQLYFALTGKPYSFKDISNTDLSSMPDDYLSRHVVGEKISGLSMNRSSMTGILHSGTLSSTLDWTFVFKNQGQSSQEARTEIGLPPGAVITGLTLWDKGEPQEAAFAASGKAEKYVTATSTAGHDCPAMITDLGHGRMLLHCYPVSEAEELKVSVKMVVPMKPDGATNATLALPRLIAENFSLGDEHQIRLRSSQTMGSTCKQLASGANPDGTQSISGLLTKDQIENSNFLISARRDETTQPSYVLDKLAIEFQREQDKRMAQMERNRNRRSQFHRLDREVLEVSIDGSRSIQKQFEELTNALEKRTNSRATRKKPQIRPVKPQYVVENISQIAAPAPKNLLIVVDGSATVKDYRQELLKALKGIPSNVPARILLASSDEKNQTAMSIQQALKRLESEDFVGGHDNLKSVVRAAELAGETERGAVLWIHGPQPILNQEIYIMAPYVSAPSFYELPLGAGETDTYDFFKNHAEIGPFAQVPRCSRSVSDDLLSFFSKWRANIHGYEACLSQVDAKPDQGIAVSEDEGLELMALHAEQKVKTLILGRHIRKAARVAVAYGLVTPVSCALVSEATNRNIDIDDAAMANGSGEDTSSEGAGSGTVLFAKALPGSVPAALPVGGVQGATSGTMAPQGMDASYVQGINTAGTVRVNNLANLEALLNIISNLLEVGLALAGVITLLHGLANNTAVLEIFGTEIELSRERRLAIGLGLVMLGLCFPGLVNWFVASARDANLFS